MVTAAGGIGIPVRVDHTVDAEVAALFDRVQQEQGRLDLMVNNAWGGYHDSASDISFDAVFWEQPLARFDRMFTAGVRSHVSASWFAVPLMLPQRRGLIVNTTLDIAADHYDRALFYLASKQMINYLTFGMAHDLYQRGGYEIAVIALAPGWMRTEAVMGNTFPHTLPTTPEDLDHTESVEYVGRAIVALASDPDVIKKSGQTLRVRDLAHEYGFTDIDGRQPA
jgi:NAD(P)-dependent dehydrogenase (short-subunit alcohol dehydrogenase family)